MKSPGWGHPIILTTTYAHPSPYAELLTTSSMGADMGSTAPCNTGLARTGVLRLGNRFGSNVWSTPPTVCGCILGLDRELIDWLDWVFDVGIDGGSGDCTTFSDEDSSSGGSGRNMRTGTFRNGCDGEGRRVFEMR